MKQILLLLALISPSFAQLPAIDYAGMFFSTTQGISSVPIRKVSSLPGTCTAFGSAASSNAVLYQGRVYQCTSTNTWAFAVGQTAALTSGRVPFVTTGGVLTDSDIFKFNSGTSGLSITTSLTGPSLNITTTHSTRYAYILLGTEGGPWLLKSGVVAGGNDFSISQVGDATATRFIITRDTRRVGLNTHTPAATLDVNVYAAGDIGHAIRAHASQTANILETQNSSGTALTYVDASGRLYPLSIAFASLGTPSNGAVVYCSDCTKATPCAGSGNGAIAKRLNGAWDCD